MHTLKKNYIEYLIALVLFGTNGVLASHISLTSVQIVFLRTGIGSLLLVSLFLIKGGRFHIRKDLKAYGFLTLAGIMMGSSWMLLYEAYRYVGVSIASLCMYSSLVLVMISSFFLFKEPLTHRKLLSFLIASSGTFLVNVSALTEQLSIHGLILGMCSCCTYAAMIISAKLAPQLPDLEKSTWQLITSFLTTAVFSFFRGQLLFTIHTNELGWILTLGLVNTGLGCFLYYSSISKLPAQTIAICDNIELLSAILSSVVFLNERLEKIQILGAVLIIAGAISSALTTSIRNRSAIHTY